MADLLDFMLNKKDSKKNKKSIADNQDRNNYSIFMPVGVYDSSEDDFVDLDTTNRVDPNIYPNRDSAPSQSYQEPSAGRRGDYNPYEMERLKSDEQLIELKRMISKLEDDAKRLQDKITKLNNTNSNLDVEKSRYEFIANNYRKMIEKIVKIMPYYKEIEFTGVGSPEEWKDKKLVEVFVTCIEKIVLELCEKDEEIAKLKEDLTKAVASQQFVKSNNLQGAPKDIPVDIADISENSNGNLNVDLDDSVNNAESIFDELNVDVPSIDLMGNIEENNTLSFGDTDSLEIYKGKLEADAESKAIFEVIGETGLARVSDLKETDIIKNTFVTGSGEFSAGLLSKKMKVLEDFEITTVQNINTGRKGGNEKLYSLSELGINLYKYMFRANPAESEMESVKRQHTSLEHGYFIKTVVKEMQLKGYEVSDSHEDCIRKPLIVKNDGDEKRRVEADLIAVKSGTEYIIECEMGTTSDADMNKKLDKLVLVTNVISFMMSNQEALKSTVAKVDKWISKQGVENLKGYTFRFTTIDAFKKKEFWQNKGPF